MKTLAILLSLLFLHPLPVGAADSATPLSKNAWQPAELQPFMKKLAGYVVAHHMRRDDSPMRGKIYEFYLPDKDQQGYGGGIDTMHDGGWFGNACILAYRATRDPYYLEIVRDWIMPFYLKMLNHSDTLFPDRQAAFSDGQLLPPDRSAAGKGFIPYWWDDGHGVNFDAIVQGLTIGRLQNKWGFTNRLADPDDRSGRLAGYSHGTSNHLALNIFPMLANYWLLSRDPQAAEGIAHLRQQRIYQVRMDLPFLTIADLVAHGQAEKAYQVAGGYDRAPWPPETPLYRAMVQKIMTAMPGFLDDPAGRYYSSAVAGRVGPATAKRLAQMTYDCIVLADLWYGQKRRPRGLAIAADNPKLVWIENGRFSSMAGDDPALRIGSRMGPQTLWACAQSLQLLRAFPDAWPSVYRGKYTPPVAGWSEPPLEQVVARLQEELDEGLRFWRRQFETLGYLRPDWLIGWPDDGLKEDSSIKLPKYYWSHRASETGGYAHLLAACAEYLNLLAGKQSWSLAASPR